jgi:small subunit ribosomal protein S21
MIFNDPSGCWTERKHQVSKAGIFADIKRRRHHETPIEKRKRKAIARRKKRYR